MLFQKIKQRLLRLLRIFFKPSHLGLIWRDYRKKTGMSRRSDKEHLAAAMQWLARAHNVTGAQGVSAGYWFDFGWKPAYPETTGYIIPTFIDYFKISGEEDFLKRACQMGDWEIEVQLPGGAVRGGIGVNSHPIVFNTGQVILGWLALFRATQESRFLQAAMRAADWLVKSQDADGKWSKFVYLNTLHTYNSRVAWSLFEIAEITKEDKYRRAAEKHMRWILSLAQTNGWIDYMGFRENEYPLTHTIAYALSGLAESVRYLSGQVAQKTKELLENACQALMICYERRKKDPYQMPRYLPARFDSNWRGRADYSCLTGNAQMAIVWLQLYQINQDARFLNAALKLIDQLKALQSLDSKNPVIHGGLAGSYPIWGGYKKYAYPNWATKFFADAIILQESIMSDLEKSICD